MKRLLLAIGVFGSIVQFAQSAAENGILGDPYVNCGPNGIEVRFDTRNPFKGVVFVKDQLEWPECRSAPIDAESNGFRNASISLNFKDCSLERRRSSNPRGIFLGTQIIVAFQPEYLTKYDRVYNVQCFYMERHCALEKELLIDMPPAPMQTQQVPMPVCRYEVLDGSPTGPPVQFAKVGQMVYHKWTCDSQTEGQFCMVVHSCKVDDGNGDQVELIDTQGCAKDKFLLSNLDYVSDLMVGKEAHVYKYADRPNLFFDCKISLTVKEPGQEFCDIPNCPDPPRRRRSTVEERKIGSNAVSPDYIIPKEMSKQIQTPSNTFEVLEHKLCMSDWGLSSIVLANLLTLTASGVLFYLGARKSREISFE